MYFTLLSILQVRPKVDELEAIKLAVLRQLPQIESAFAVKVDREKFHMESDKTRRVSVDIPPLSVFFDRELKMLCYANNKKTSLAQRKVRTLQSDLYRTDSEWRQHAVRAMTKIWPDVKFFPKNCRMWRFGEEKLWWFSPIEGDLNAVSLSIPSTFRGKAGNSFCTFSRGTGRLVTAHCGGFNAKPRRPYIKPLASGP